MLNERVKIANTAIGILGARYASRPFYARYHITHRCNYRCRMCGLHRLADRDRELDIGRIGKVAEKLARIGARHVVITGGEPFLREDLPEAVAAFADRRFSVRVQTNGGPQVSRDVLARCEAAGLRDISVSIDTLDRDLQDNICRSRNVVENALRTLKLAVEILPMGISQANVVASRYNFEELPSLVRHFHDMGVYTYITPVMIHAGREGEYKFRSGDREFCLEDIDKAVRDRIIDELLDLRRWRRGLTNSSRYLEDYRKYLATGRCDWHCEAGTLCLDVYPDGCFTICKEKPPQKSVLDPDFEDYYFGADFRSRARDTIKACTGCFYGEYREPQYAVRDLSVFAEWVRDWFLAFRMGMKQGRDN